MAKQLGKLIIIFTDEGPDIKFPLLGNITPAMIEKTLPMIYRSLAMARNAERMKDNQANKERV